MSKRVPAGVSVLAVVVAGLLAAALTAAVMTRPERTVGGEHVALIAAAPARAGDEGSARFSLAMRATDGESTVVIRQTGVAESRGRRVAFSITVDRTDGPPQGPVTFLVDGRTVYLHLPKSRSVGLTEGKRWLVTKVADRAEANATAATPDPLAILETLTGVGRSVRRVGTEVVDGARTTHYRLTSTVQAAAARLSAQRQKEVAPTIGQFLKRPLPVEAWIDGDGRPRRVALRVDTPDSKLKVTVDVDRYGTPVHLDLPPDREVYEVDTFAEAVALAGIE